MTKALLIVDVQNGFCPGGNLPVPEGDKTVPVINRLIDGGGYDYIVASQDWHPADHGSFASQHPGKNVFDMGTLSGQPQMMWPDHCVQGTKDAEFHPDLKMDKVDFIQQKGQNASVDSYSAFRDNDRAAVTRVVLDRDGAGRRSNASTVAAKRKQAAPFPRCNRRRRRYPTLRRSSSPPRLATTSAARGSRRR